ncbi:hypothetical protein EZV62_015541 [Acer yangbiense]|uniref:HAT C-terminal dimerisation domain-containing protein n=1 Tax=Acer yangbiense TaxID=1000413 RepID=A0A5C7HMW6_9ROSI|nr:hypothetical protein EZV62_015541 [Acer yangbiense]
MLSSLKEVLVDLYECYVKLYGGVGVKSNDGVFETFCEKEKFSEDSLWGQKQQDEDVSMGKSEVELYLLEACEKLNDKFDLLAWWKNCSIKFSILSMITNDVFSMPISTVTFESAFGTEGCILDPFRSSLTLKLVEGLILTGNWLSASYPIAELETIISNTVLPGIVESSIGGKILSTVPKECNTELRVYTRRENHQKSRESTVPSAQVQSDAPGNEPINSSSILEYSLPNVVSVPNELFVQKDLDLDIRNRYVGFRYGGRV